MPAAAASLHRSKAIAGPAARAYARKVCRQRSIARRSDPATISAQSSSYVAQRNIRSTKKARGGNAVSPATEQPAHPNDRRAGEETPVEDNAFVRSSQKERQRPNRPRIAAARARRPASPAGSAICGVRCVHGKKGVRGGNLVSPTFFPPRSSSRCGCGRSGWPAGRTAHRAREAR
jgi:hypothetical protein